MTKPRVRYSVWQLSCRYTAITIFASLPRPGLAQAPSGWLIHDLNRPRPPIVKPVTQRASTPADAVVLFDGSDLRHWRSADGGEPQWVIRGDAMESVPESGYLHTADRYGDVQLHIEWASPENPAGLGQERGNSGVFLMGKYELQVLDSYENDTYPDGQAASIYGQYPPLVNACLPPGEWQTYDILFRRPRFDQQGKLASPARMTVLHNGILVQDNRELWGPTSWLQHHPYEAHPDRLPLALQDHGNPVRYRNIWLRELSEFKETVPKQSKQRSPRSLSTTDLDRYAGSYVQDDGTPTDVLKEKDSLWLQILGRERLQLVPAGDNEFLLRWTDGRIVFETAQKAETKDSLGPSTDTHQARKAERLTLHLGGRTYPASRRNESSD
jgi:hypothetical protein